MAIILKKVHPIPALLSMIVGIATWVSIEFYIGWEEVFSMPPHFFGFLMAIIGFFVGQVLFSSLGKGKVAE